MLQGGRLRDDETEIEREVRVQWVYTTDGLMFVAIIYDVVELIIYGSDDKVGYNNLTLALIISLIVNTLYLIGNVALLYFLKERMSLAIKWCALRPAGYSASRRALARITIHEMACRRCSSGFSCARCSTGVPVLAQAAPPLHFHA